MNNNGMLIFQLKLPIHWMSSLLTDHYWYHIVNYVLSGLRISYVIIYAEPSLETTPAGPSLRKSYEL